MNVITLVGKEAAVKLRHFKHTTFSLLRHKQANTFLKESTA